MSIVHPVVCSPIIDPVVDVLDPVAWGAGQTLAQRLAADYGVIAAGRYTDWTTGRLKATVGDDLDFAYAAGTLAADGSTQAAGLAPLHAGKGVLHDASRTNTVTTPHAPNSCAVIQVGRDYLIVPSTENVSHAQPRFNVPCTIGPNTLAFRLGASGYDSCRIVLADGIVTTKIDFKSDGTYNVVSGVASVWHRDDTFFVVVTATDLTCTIYFTPLPVLAGPSTFAGDGVSGITVSALSFTPGVGFPVVLDWGATTVATYGATITGVSLPAPVGGDVWNALTGGEMTLIVDDVRLAGSGDLASPSYNKKIASVNTADISTPVQYEKNSSGAAFIVNSKDGATPYTLAGTWSRNDNIVSIVNVRYNTTLATWQFRVNYINLTLGQTALAQSDEQGWLTYDGSFNPDSALQKLMFFYLNAYPGYLRRYVLCNRNLTGAETMKLLTKDYTVVAYELAA